MQGGVTMRVISEYEKQAINFLKAHNAKMSISHISDGFGHWKKSQMTGGWLYRVRIDREGKSWTFQFSDSLRNYWDDERPTKYNVLACVEKYEPYGDVWDFTRDYGYEICDRESYKKTEKTFKAVRREYKNVVRMFGDCLDELCEIY